ncbi:YceD family protein [Methylocapsa aurea]|uniref:YceD family protein n=1 Tax=Methylocapsa aurea TaxID=663610 RepID=UPI000A940083|nr:DUF177 domain-containing protein [Methylocapsa aurea]
MKSKGNPGAKSRNADAGGTALRSEAGHFSRPLAVDDVPEGGLEISIRADPAECAAMAQNDGLEAILSLDANFQATKQGRGGIRIRGRLHALAVQTCVVSLDPFEAEIEADIDVGFAPAPEIASESGRASWDLDTGSEAPAAFSTQGRDPPDPIVDGRIDLGALAEEFLVLSLDPYPRKPGARFDESILSGDPVEKVSPFAVLKKLKEEP